MLRFTPLRFTPLRLTTSLLSAGLLLGATACGGGDATPSTAPAGADVLVRAVDGVAWDAKSYTATAADGTVTLFGVNDSSLPHNLHVKDKDGNDVGKAIDLPSNGSDGTIELTVTPGEYRIVCEIPGHANMDSTLTVS